MSATIGTPASTTIAGSALASASWGTATRTMSAPWVARAWAWIRVAPTSSVLVVVIDWMEMGAPSPMSTVPRRMRRVGWRCASIVRPLSEWKWRDRKATRQARCVGYLGSDVDHLSGYLHPRRRGHGCELAAARDSP